MPLVHAQIIGTSEEYDTYPSLIVTVDNLRLLFNGGEGIQRLSNEHGIKLAKVEHFFLSHLTWHAWGGTPDLMFYLSDTGRKGWNIYGPAPLVDFVTLNHYYFWKPEFMLALHEISNKSVLNITDEVVVRPILLLPQNTTPHPAANTRILNPCYDDVIDMHKQIEEEEAAGAAPPHDDDHNEEKATTEKEEEDNHDPGDDQSVMGNDNVQRNDEFRVPRHTDVQTKLLSLALNRPKFITRPQVEKTSVCYCVHTPDAPGKFDMAAAAKLGVKPGPLCGRLVKGETIELPNGQKVSPEMCVGAPTPGPILIVVSCPSQEYVASLTTHPGFEPYIEYAKKGRIIYLFHITPLDIMGSEPYQNWMKKFTGKTVQHISMFSTAIQHKICEDVDLHYSSLKGSLDLQMKLHKLDQEVFTLQPKAKSKFEVPKNVVPAEGFMKIKLQPVASAGIDKTEIDAPLKLSEIKHSEETEKLIKEYQHKAKKVVESQENVPEYLQNLSKEEAEIVFLGTGAAIPFKLRSVSAIYVHFFSRGGLLLDVGESTYSQMCRKYGDRIGEILMGLKCIWISHKHADHHLSLPSILIHRQKAFERANREFEPITLVAPYYTHGYLDELSWFQEVKFNYFHCSVIKQQDHKLSNFFRETFGLTKIWNIRVPHIVDSYGLIMESENGWKIVYSGDTSLCEELVREGQGATVLIHEATMENCLQHEAVWRGHSSTSEAISVGRKMNAYRTILTHFSARHHHYPVPDFIDPSLPTYESPEGTMVAFDLMTVNLKHLPQLPLLIPPLVQLHKEELNIVK